METVFTISGADPGDVGPPLPPSPAGDMLCAMQVKPLVITGGLATLGGLGAGVFSIYKFGQRRVGTGFVGAAAAVGLWYLGGRLVNSALKSFQVCKGMSR
jgi:hypothetical protein